MRAGKRLLQDLFDQAFGRASTRALEEVHHNRDKLSNHAGVETQLFETARQGRQSAQLPNHCAGFTSEQSADCAERAAEATARHRRCARRPGRLGRGIDQALRPR